MRNCILKMNCRNKHWFGSCSPYPLLHFTAREAKLRSRMAHFPSSIQYHIWPCRSAWTQIDAGFALSCIKRIKSHSNIHKKIRVWGGKRKRGKMKLTDEWWTDEYNQCKRLLQDWEVTLQYMAVSCYLQHSCAVWGRCHTVGCWMCSGWMLSGYLERGQFINESITDW